MKKLMTALLCSAALGWPAVQAQEIKSATKYGDMSTVSQDMLNRAATDSENFLQTNGDYASSVTIPTGRSTPPTCRGCGGLDLPDRSEESLETSPIVVNGTMS